MTKRSRTQWGASRRTASAKRTTSQDEQNGVRARILANILEVRMLDPEIRRAFIRQRQAQNQDRFDEVWEGVYLVPPLANNPHQGLVAFLLGILFHVLTLEKRGQVLAGANVSDRSAGWEHNYRAPDISVILNQSRAIDCTTHFFGGPDFLVEVESPEDETEEKIPFYSQLQVQELLVIHRDTRELRLYRYDVHKLALVQPIDFASGKWLVSKVVPLAFRRQAHRKGGAIEIRRIDGRQGHWKV